MWMLLAINAVMLLSLLVTLWRLHHLQAWLAVRDPDFAAGRQPVQPVERRRREPAVPRHSALDEFPSENSIEDANATFRPPRSRSSGGRSPHRLAPVGR